MVQQAIQPSQQEMLIGGDVISMAAQLAQMAAANQIDLQSLLGYVDPASLGPGFDSLQGLQPTLARESFEAALQQANQQYNLDLQRFGLQVADFNFQQRLAQAQMALNTQSLLASLRGPENALQYNFALNNLAAPAGEQADPTGFLADINQPVGEGGGGSIGGGGAGGGTFEINGQPSTATNQTEALQQIGSQANDQQQALLDQRSQEFIQRVLAGNPGARTVVGSGNVLIPDPTGTGSVSVPGIHDRAFDFLFNDPTVQVTRLPNGDIEFVRVEAPAAAGAATPGAGSGPAEAAPAAAAPAPTTAQGTIAAPEGGNRVLARNTADVSDQEVTDFTSGLAGGAVSADAARNFLAGLNPLAHGGTIEKGEQAVVGDDPTGRGREAKEIIEVMPDGSVQVTPARNVQTKGLPRFALGGTIFGQQDFAQSPALQKLTGGQPSRAFGATSLNTMLPGTQQQVPFGSQLDWRRFNELAPSEMQLYRNFIETPRAQGGLGLDFTDSIELARRAAPIGHSFGPAQLVA